MSPDPESPRAVRSAASQHGHLSHMTHLECTKCGREHDHDRLIRLSPCCQMPLYARYDLGHAARTMNPKSLQSREPTQWRYSEVMPVRNPSFRISLGEGMTPLIDAPRLARELRVKRILLKDEGQNPTGSFKARGMSAAVSRAWELGARELAVPSAGNAGAAAAAYAAAAGLPCNVVVPRDTPRVIIEETRYLGANLELVDGAISDAGARVAEGASSRGWFDLSTLKEPYRVEGKKTMGYELFEQLGGRLPEVIVYPTGGGTGLVGMWKAFDEMEQMGWIGSDRPRMISVQAEGCAPIVRAWETGELGARKWADPTTYASGLRVPAAIGDFLILSAIRKSKGAAVSVSDEAIRQILPKVGALSGVFTGPEGAAAAAALPLLLARGIIGPESEVVLFITGSGHKYV